MDDLSEFEQAAKRRLEEFNEPKKQKKPSPISHIGPPPKGLTVVIAVRKKGSLTDLHYIHQSDSISRLQARLEAEKAAREEGFPIIGHVVDYF